MGPNHSCYPGNLLNALKKGSKLQKELQDAILKVLDEDPQVHALIRAKAKKEPPYSVDILNVLNTHPEVQKLLRDKTWDRYVELVKSGI